jgi:hypothetical protein
VTCDPSCIPPTTRSLPLSFSCSPWASSWPPFWLARAHRPGQSPTLALSSSPTLTFPSFRCGKNYHQGDPTVAPGHQFPLPATSSSPLLAFLCYPAIRPYVQGDSASVVLSSQITSLQIAGTAPIQDDGKNGTLSVSVSINGKTVASGTMALNDTRVELPVSLSGLSTSTIPYPIDCTATYESQTFHANSTFLYLPPNSNGSITKLDLRTGAILVKSADGSGDYAPIFPIGFYTEFDYYLGANFSMMDDLHAQGCVFMAKDLMKSVS